MRGNPHVVKGFQEADGSIPAGAGEPVAVESDPPVTEVYPRGCGGTWLDDAGRALKEGLSPRVRGNLRDLGTDAYPYGSIPAGAGEPQRDVSCSCPRTVYPRGCGGTVRKSLLW